MTNKRKFKTGAVRDSEESKPDYIESVSWTAFRKFGEYMTSKKSRYGKVILKKESLLNLMKGR